MGLLQAFLMPWKPPEEMGAAGQECTLLGKCYLLAGCLFAQGPLHWSPSEGAGWLCPAVLLSWGAGSVVAK